MKGRKPHQIGIGAWRERSFTLPLRRRLTAHHRSKLSQPDSRWVTVALAEAFAPAPGTASVAQVCPGCA